MSIVVDDGSNSTQKPPFLVRRRTVFTWLAPLCLLAASLIFDRRDGGWAAFWGGVVLVVLGEVVRFWAAGYIVKDTEIATGGPYAHVRNPLYFGSFLLAIGYGLVSGLGWWGVGAMVPLFLLFHLSAISYEETFLKSRFGGSYKEYLRRVPRLLPSPWPRTQGSGHFEWAQAVRNREPISALFALLFVGLLSLGFFIHVKLP
ncbi:MAG: isoprenylcysteine carboxylmethyltransferase family protein [Armatimonadota bacterium]|nr:isoprenylcysteine carboxylmethyltransferase family protein [Armatimonadota bacterium]